MTTIERAQKRAEKCPKCECKDAHFGCMVYEDNGLCRRCDRKTRPPNPLGDRDDQIYYLETLLAETIRLLGDEWETDNVNTWSHRGQRSGWIKHKTSKLDASTFEVLLSHKGDAVRIRTGEGGAGKESKFRTTKPIEEIARRFGEWALLRAAEEEPVRRAKRLQEEASDKKINDTMRQIANVLGVKIDKKQRIDRYDYYKTKINGFNVRFQCRGDKDTGPVVRITVSASAHVPAEVSVDVATRIKAAIETLPADLGLEPSLEY